MLARRLFDEEKTGRIAENTAKARKT